jgi:hypothetical protein
MEDEDANTPEKLRAEIEHLRRLSRGIADAQVKDAIKQMIEELQRRLREGEGTIVELDVIAPEAGKRWLRRSQIATCKQVAASTPPRIVVRLFDGSVLIVTKASIDAADNTIGQRLRNNGATTEIASLEA